MQTEEHYDSRPDTLSHIARVRELLADVVDDLLIRSEEHDESKLQEPEKSAFDRETPRLRELTYGSDAYMASLSRLQDALKHHYSENRHHPEHHEAGIRGMNLLDLIEMLVDWKAASERHEDGDIAKSIDLNQQRFGYSDDLKAAFHNTVRDMDWKHQ